MKCNLFKHGTGLLLASLFSLTTSAQLVQHERLLSFEAPEVPSFISSEKSELSITPEHYKDGTQALNWKFKPGGILSIQKTRQEKILIYLDLSFGYIIKRQQINC